MNRNYTLQEIESKLQRKSWWAMLFVLPAARRLSLFFINRTKITPNAITIGSFAFVLFSAVCFAWGSRLGLVLGAIFFEINYLFDCVDGTIARVKGLASPLGAYLDPMLDRLRIVMTSTALAYGQFSVSGGISVVFFLLLYLGLNNLILFTRAAQETAILKAGGKSKVGMELARETTRSSLLARWFDFTSKRNMMSYYHDIELDSLVFVIGPILNMVVPFLVAANILALVLILMLNVMFLSSLRRHKGVS